MNGRLLRLWAIQGIAFAALVAAERERAEPRTVAMLRIERRRRRARARCRRAELLIARAMRRGGS